MNRFEQLVKECDASIRTGHSHEVARHLGKINPARVPREWRLPLANVCRRAGLYTLGLTLLRRLVHFRDSSSHQLPATGHEIAEYSVLLLRTGAVKEALETLETVDINMVPQALLFRAFCHFVQWEFDHATPLLRQYIQTPISEYARLVGQANLCYSLVESRHHDQALPILHEMLRLTAEGGHRQLQGNCRALLAQVYFQENDFKRARAEWRAAQMEIPTAQSNDHFILTKWNLILDGLEQKNMLPFDRLRAMAVEKHDWESLREADLFSLKIKKNTERLLHLYFGTPFDGFRARIEAELGDVPSDRTFYVLGPKSASRFDLLTGLIDEKPNLKAGRKCHQLLELMLRDFYQPLRIGGLFSGLCPHEHFDVLTSPDRVHQTLRRSRLWLEEQNIPVGIVEQDGFYSVRIDGNFSFRVPLNRHAVSVVDLQFEKLRTAFSSTKPFSSHTVQAKLQMSKPTVNRLLKWGVDHGKLIRTGDTNRTIQYSLVSPRPLKQAA